VNKNALIQYVAAELPTSKLKAGLLVNTVLSGISEGLKADESVTLTGFGSFEVRATKARAGRDPNTGNPIQIAAGRRVAFKVGRGLRGEIDKAKAGS